MQKPACVVDVCDEQSTHSTLARRTLLNEAEERGEGKSREVGGVSASLAMLDFIKSSWSLTFMLLNSHWPFWMKLGMHTYPYTRNRFPLSIFAKRFPSQSYD